MSGATATVTGVAIVLALLSSLFWGVGDFAGGTATRRLPALVVVFVSQSAGLVLVAVVATARGAWTEPLGYLPWAIAAGVVGVTGLLAFYEALARGTMGVVSPIAALSILVPVIVGLAMGEWPTAVVGTGFVLAIVGVVAASGPERAAGRSLRPVILAGVAAVCFGAVLILVARGAAGSAEMTMVAMRVASVTAVGLVLLARRRSATGGESDTDDGATQHRGARLWTVVLVAGVFDVAANLTFAYSSQLSALTIVAILGSLYPAVTVLLARAIHGERMARLQYGGIIATLAGVALIAAGT